MDNPELEDLFQGTRGDPLRQECRANLREGLSSFLAALAEKYVLTRQESSVVVDVEVEADKLKKMPEEAVQTLHEALIGNPDPGVDAGTARSHLTLCA